MAGLVPAIHVFLAASLLRRGCRDEPGHDEFSYGRRFYWLQSGPQEDAGYCASINAVTKRGMAAVRSPTSRTRWMAESSGCCCRARLASILACSASPELSTSNI